MPSGTHTDLVGLLAMDGGCDVEHVPVLRSHTVVAHCKSSEQDDLKGSVVHLLLAGSQFLVLHIALLVVSWAAHMTGQASLTSCSGEPGGDDTLSVLAHKLTSARHVTSSP